MPASNLLRLSPSGNEDQRLIDDLAPAGIVVEYIHRNPRQLIVISHGIRMQPLVAIVPRGPLERTHAFARLMTRNA
jgi:hypothetical protein